MSRPVVPPLYQALRSTAAAALRGFYRKIEVTGLEHVDGSKPTILACTHPNSIVDPLLVGIFEDRPVTFCARDGLFRIPVLGQILRAVGAVAIRRRSDHPGSADNSEAFVECRRVLERGGVLSIFPEGKTHAKLRVEPLKTGIARIALDAEANREAPLGVRIVPIGLNYLVRHAFRSDVHVAFGEPIEVASLLEGNREIEPRLLVRELTDRLGDELRRVAVHVEKEEDERLIAQVTAIIVGLRAEEGLDTGGQSPAERTALVQRVIDAYHWLGEKDPKLRASLRERLDAYMDERQRLGLGGERAVLQHRGERHLGREAQPRLHRVWLVAGAPLALYGLVNSAVPYLLLRIILSIGRPSAYRVALTKLVGGGLLFSACYAGQTAWVGSVLGPLPATAYALGLVPSALFALRYVTDLRLHRLDPISLLRRLRHRGRISALRAEREALAAELAKLRHAYLAEIE